MIIGRHGVANRRAADRRATYRATHRLAMFPATTAVTAVTALVGVAAFIIPSVLQALQRDPVQMRAGQWWRVATPLLVQYSGWGQYAFNILGSILVGLAVERRYGGLRLIALYLAGGLAGNVTANIWEPTTLNGGSSDAVAGLIGALAVSLWFSARLPSWPSYLYAAYFASYLTLLDAAGVLPSMIFGAVTAGTVMALRRGGHIDALRLVLTALVIIGAGAMTAMQDGHGIGLFAGMALSLAPISPKATQTNENDMTTNDQEHGS